MDAPKCKLCGQRHWSPVCGETKRTRELVPTVRPEKVTREAPVTKPDRESKPVTQNPVTKHPISVTRGRPKKADKLTPAQKQRAYRERKANKKS
jgi:hypothetical protein